MLSRVFYALIVLHLSAMNHLANSCLSSRPSLPQIEHEPDRDAIVDTEHCNVGSKWLKNDIEGLKREMREKLHGQHIANDTVVKLLKYHINEENPSKALVFSFHGPTGVGKNLVAKMIVENLFTKKFSSQYAHLRVASDFDVDNANDIGKVKERVKDVISNKVRECPRALFILDEMEKMPNGVIDVVAPYLDVHTNVDGIDYRKAIFIFISESAGEQIAEMTMDHLRSGNTREQLTMDHFEEDIMDTYKDGRLQLSWLVKRYLVSAYVPFLPLQREHVISCTRDHAASKRVHLTRHDLEQISNKIQYIKKDGIELSKSGCKLVEAKFNLYRAHKEL